MILNEMAKNLIAMGIRKWHIFKLQSAFAPNHLHISDTVAENAISALKIRYADRIIINCKFSKENDRFASFVVDSELNCFSTDNEAGTKVVFGNLTKNRIKEIWDKTTMNYKMRHLSKYLGIKDFVL